MTYPILNNTAHADVHPVLHNAYVDAKGHGGLKGDGTTEDAGALDAFVAAVNAGGGLGYFPPGTYKLPTGYSILMPGPTRYIGAGYEHTSITATNAYAFSSADATPGGRYVVENMLIQLTGGSTSGGAYYQETGDPYLHDLRCQGAGSTCTQPLVHLDGLIDGFVERVWCKDFAGDGMFIESTGFGGHAANAYTLRDCRWWGNTQTGTTDASLHIYGGSNPEIDGCIFEGSKGYQIRMEGVDGAFVTSNWFENGGNHQLLLENCFTANIQGNMFQYTSGAISPVNHIRLTYSGSPDFAHHNRIVGNQFANDATGGVNLSIGANVEDTYVAHNRRGRVIDGQVSDSGIRSFVMGNDAWYFGKKFLEFEELAPGTPAPAANKARVYVTDDGTGKTVLVVDFATGGGIGLARQGETREFRSGSGSPQGVLTAPVGTLYGRTDGGANTTLYVKESGTGNSGWVAK